MPIDAVANLESELDALASSDDLSSLLLFRILAIEFPHRIAGGRTQEQAAYDMKNFLAALSLAETLSLEEIELTTFQRLHAILDGRTDPTPFRRTSVAVRANIPGSRMRLTGSTPAEVVPRMQEMLDGIYRNPLLGRFDRIALGYFELIRTHAFEDGNGRLSRLLLTALIASTYRSSIPLTITRVMRSDFPLYHRIIRCQTEDVYFRWLRYVSGAITAELHAAGRCAVTLLSLATEERNAALREVRNTIEMFRYGEGAEETLSSAVRVASRKAAKLLLGLMA